MATVLTSSAVSTSGAAADGPARRDRDAGEAVVQRTPDIAHTILKMEQDAKRNRAAPADDALRRRRRAWEEMQRVTAEHASFDKLRMSAHGEPVEPCGLGGLGGSCAFCSHAPRA